MNIAYLRIKAKRKAIDAQMEVLEDLKRTLAEMRKGYEHFDRIFDQQDEIIKLPDIILKKYAELLEEMKQFEKRYYPA